MQKVLIIAEAGVNHNGDIELAKKLVDAAKLSGADIVKFQTWITDELVVRNAPMAKYQKENDNSEDQYEMIKKLELPFEAFVELKKYAEKIGIGFLSTPDDFKSLDFLVDKLGLRTIKIGSGEINNLPFIKAVGSKNVDVIISTGMSNLENVKRAYYALKESGAKKITILHCVSNYPAKLETLNLRVLSTLKETFGVSIGFSDHTEGHEAALVSVALGAEVIEKHFTLDKNMPGPDHKMSMDPKELSQFIKFIRNAELSLSGNGCKEIQHSEKDIRSVVTKGIYVKDGIKAGEKIVESMLAFKRPVGEIPVDMINEVVGRCAVRDLHSGQPVTWKDIK